MSSILVAVASALVAIGAMSTADTAPGSYADGLAKVAQNIRVAEIETQQENLDADVHHPGQKGNEAEAILKESKESFKVTHKDFEDCMKDWGPSTQMSKGEWEQSCRSTLKYFPEGN